MLSDYTDSKLDKHFLSYLEEIFYFSYILKPKYNRKKNCRYKS